MGLYEYIVCVQNMIWMGTLVFPQSSAPQRKSLRRAEEYAVDFPASVWRCAGDKDCQHEDCWDCDSGGQAISVATSHSLINIPYNFQQQCIK